MSNQIQVQIEAPKTVEKFVELFSSIHKVDKKAAEDIYKVEKFHCLNILEEKGLLEKVTPLSAMGVFLDVVSNGLSFSPQAKHVYLLSRNVKTNRKTEEGKDIYEERLYFQTQPDGKIFQAQKAGSIDYVTKPVIVYEGDVFEPATNESGYQIIIHKPSIPRKSKKIIAGYVYVVFKGGHREPTWLVQEDIDRLKAYSAAQNGKWDNNLKKRVPGNPNPLYSSGVDGQIDVGFFSSKIINAAMKNVRKSSTPSVNEVDGEVEEQLPIATGNYIPSMVVTPAGQVTEQVESQPSSTNQYEF